MHGAVLARQQAKSNPEFRAVHVSTDEVYGSLGGDGLFSETTAYAPNSPYAASKQASETLCHTYHHLYGIDVTVFRYFTVYGPAGRPDMSPFRFVQWISEGKQVTVFGDGTQSRDFTYVDDIASGTVLGIQKVGYEVINLGSDKPISLTATIKRYEELIGSEANIIYRSPHPADVAKTWADVAKAKRLLDWQPVTDFEEGSKKLVNWYRENRPWAKTIETS